METVSWKVEGEEFVGDDAGAVEGVVEPEVGSERVMRGCGDDAVFEGVAWSEPEDAHGFDAHVMIGGIVHDGGIGIVGDRARENVGSAAAGMRDADEGNFDLLEAAVVIEIEAGKLANADFGIDFDDAMNFFAGITVTLKADRRFEK